MKNLLNISHRTLGKHHNLGFVNQKIELFSHVLYAIENNIKFINLNSINWVLSWKNKDNNEIKIKRKINILKKKLSKNKNNNEIKIRIKRKINILKKKLRINKSTIKHCNLFDVEFWNLERLNIIFHV